jgi:hypothetical protein
MFDGEQKLNATSRVIYNIVCGQWKLKKRGNLCDREGIILHGASKLVRLHSIY